MFKSAAKSITGKQRPTNQDAVYCDDRKGLWIVADGVGGHKGGEVASTLVCQQVPAALSTGLSAQEALMLTHQDLRQQSHSEPSLENMAATVILAHQVSQQIQFHWIGDCRAYLLRDGQLKQLSRDHTVVQELLDIGVINPQQIKQHPKRHVITSCLGGRTTHSPTIDTVTVTSKQGDRFLLSSDGLHDEVSLQQLQHILSDTPAPQEAVNRLVELGNELSGADNISAIVIDWTTPEEQDDGKSGVHQSMLKKIKGLLGRVDRCC